MDRLQSQKSCNLNEFTDMIHHLLKAAWGDDWGTFCEEFPNGRDPQSVKLPVITYSLKGKKPGTVGKNTQEIKPRHRQDFVTQENGEPLGVTMYAQIFDYSICFDIWSETNTEANKLATRFEEFMKIYTGYFMEQGVRQILFLEQVNGNQSYMWRDNIVSRKLTYFMQLEEHTVVVSDVIKEVIAKVAAVRQLSKDSEDNSKQYIDFKLP